MDKLLFYAKGGDFMNGPNFKLKELRYMHNLKQTDMAEKLNIAETTYNRKENGDSEFTESEILSICRIFFATPEEIFFDNAFTKPTSKA